MYADLKGKVVVVTGGSSGIGEAISKRFVEEGCVVYNFDLKEKPMKGVEFIRVDVSNRDSVVQGVRSVVGEVGKLHVVVNNAGVESYGTVTETSEEEWDRIINVNLRGAFLVTKYSIPEILRSGGGVIIYMASVQSFSIQNRVAAYATSKHALVGLAKSVALDYAPQVRAVAVAPGSVRTPLLEWAARSEVGEDPQAIEEKIKEWGNLHPMGRVASPEEIANVVVFLSSNQASFITGTTVVVDGGLVAKLPQSVPKGEKRF